MYDVTKYLDDHPGGAEVILEAAGKDGDSMFEDIGHSSEARKKMKEFFIGNLKVGVIFVPFSFCLQLFFNTLIRLKHRRIPANLEYRE